MAKIIAHIDLNAFFARAEEIRRPELENKPIIVGGLGERGVVSTCSYAARKYGVHSAMPIGEARRLCPQGVYLEPDFPYYSMLSSSFFAYLGKYSRLVERASIDEGYVDMSEFLKGKNNPEKELRILQNGLLREIGLKCSIGVATNKWLAKMASDMKKPMGITILRKKDMPTMLYPLDIGDYFGIGKKTAEKLRSIGIKTIGDLAKRIDEPYFSTFFGKGYSEVKRHLSGQGDDIVNPFEEEAKSISRSITLPYDSIDEDYIKENILSLSNEVAGALINEKKLAKTITLTIRDSSFSTHSKSLTLEQGINDAKIIASTCKKLFDENFSLTEVRLIGVGTSNLISPYEETVQMSFWNYEDYEKRDETKLLVKELNRKMKSDSLMLAKEAKRKKNEGNK